MARPPTTTARAGCPNMVVQGDYIDMDLSASRASSPRRREFEFQNVVGGGAEQREADAASPADELFYKGNLLPLHLPPRLQLVQKLLQEQEAGGRQEEAPNAEDVMRRDCANAAAAAASAAGSARKYTWSRRLKLMKRWASKEYLRALFAAKPTSANGNGSAPDQEEACHHRKSFSGIIRRVRCAAARPSPLCSSSSSSSSSTPSGGNGEGFFRAAPSLKRSSSANSEKEGAIQGAIAYCKRSQQQMLSARRSVSDVVFCSALAAASTTVSAAPEAQERQEISRG